jgi:hypothetical protein
VKQDLLYLAIWRPGSKQEDVDEDSELDARKAIKMGLVDQTARYWVYVAGEAEGGVLQRQTLADALASCPTCD